MQNLNLPPMRDMIEGSDTNEIEIPNRKWLFAMSSLLIGSPLYQAYDLVPLYLDLFTSGAFQSFISPDSEAYDFTIACLILCEISLNVAVFLGWLALGFLFAKKHKHFPRAYSWQIALIVFALIADALALNLIAGGEELFSADLVEEFVKILFCALIAIPYMFSAEMRGRYFVNSGSAR